MKPDQSIELHLVRPTGEAANISNVVLDIHFRTNGNFRYGFRLGHTDQHGRLSVAYADLETLRRRDAEENLMDYNTPLDNCDPEVKILLVSEQQLREQANNAVRFYRTLPAWAGNWPANKTLKAWEGVVELGGPVTLVSVPAEEVRG